MKITVLYVGTSLLAPLKKAEGEINAQYGLDLLVAAHNCGVSLPADEWRTADRDIASSEIVFIIHVTDEENASQIIATLDRVGSEINAVIAFNCMPALMRRTRMGRLDFASLMKQRTAAGKGSEDSSHNLVRKVGSWMADYFKGRSRGSSGGNRNGNKNGNKQARHGQYLKLIGRLPSVLKFIPSAGRLRDVKNYLNLFCYFLQPTPNNIHSMLLYAIKHYAATETRIKRIDAAEALPTVGAYHPDASRLFESFGDYRKWYESSRKRVSSRGTRSDCF